jgi:hypothetical protein
MRWWNLQLQKKAANGLEAFKFFCALKLSLENVIL